MFRGWRGKTGLFVGLLALGGVDLAAAQSSSALSDKPIPMLTREEILRHKKAEPRHKPH
ncbi:hypothetical protein [Breoghania sp.]|uniref:hypothetical protein n=1 Tax=Breoghania sp. TaxID=2065378 RepID=UPI002614F231|nr:hypothetical protein [Breoghania sp.]MDJ0932209.1 hypothetical protein [Breoghania sp.]